MQKYRVMSTRQHASRSSAQKSLKCGSKSPFNESRKMKTNKECVGDAMGEELDDGDVQNHGKLSEIYSMLKTVMAKLDTLDDIKKRIVNVEQDVKELKSSIEFAHAEVKDLKEEVERSKKSDIENRMRIDCLEDENRRLHDSIVDLKARSMRDNLLFHNVEEEARENTTDKIFQLLEEKLEIPDARNKIKIDRSHRVGRKRDTQRKPRAIVVKFNFYQDRELVRRNAKKLKGTKIGISEQFPEEIEKIRQTLYPEMRKAKAQGHQVRLVRDKLFINNIRFN